MTTGNQLFDALQKVADESSFLTFLEILGRDRADEAARERDTPSSPWGPGANGWENQTIDSFLEAAVGWAADSRNAPALVVADNPWKRCADILYAGKFYE